MSLNLSGRPFTNRRLFWLFVATIFFVTLWFGLWITAEQTRVSALADLADLRIKAQEAQVEQARLEQERLKQTQQKVVLTEQQALELASARLLVERKAFSWSRIVSDIERFVPKDARILSVKVDGVVEAADGATAARVEVKALGKTSAQMTEMMTSLDKSGGRFMIDQAGQDEAVDTGEVPFTIMLTYRPSEDGEQ